MKEAPIGGIARYNRVLWKDYEGYQPYIVKCEVCEYEDQARTKQEAEGLAGIHYDFSLPMAAFGEPIHTVRYGLRGQLGPEAVE